MALTILAIGLIAGLSSVATLAISCALFLLCRRNASRSQRTKPTSERKCHRLTITNLADLSKPRQSVTITAIPPDPEKGWVPQIREVHELGKYNAASRYSLGGPRSLATPPPAYEPKARGSQSDSLSNKKMISPPCLKTDFSRDTGAVSSPFSVSPVTPILLSPNPRTASFSSKLSLTSPSLRSGVAASISNSALPRNMLVCSTFTPTRDDEMLITVGESLRVLEQFEDHWSLVQRDGSEDAELGVVPTHCLVGPAFAV